MIRFRLVALFLILVALFNFPLLGVANRPVLVWGVPVLYLYLFGIWVVAILWIRMVMDRPKPPQT